MPVVRRTDRVLVAALVLALAGGQASRATPQSVPARQKEALDLGKVTRKRQIAPLFSADHADWLTRADRDASEQPEKVLDALRIPEGAVVADVGAGVGYFTWRLARRVGPKGKVIAVEVQQKMLDLMAMNLKERRIANVEIVLGGVRDPRLPIGSLDLALLVDVYHEFAEPEAMMQHIRRALKRNGRLVLIEYRKEDPAVPILPLHKMSTEEVRSEIEPIGFRFVEALEFLPTQHILVFTPRGEAGAGL